MNQKHFYVLDAVRGIAAFFVLFSHTKDYWPELFFAHEYLAVDIFFSLSGFVIAHAYESKLDNSDITIPKFVAIRTIRLYPLYFLGLALGIMHLIFFRDQGLASSSQITTIIVFSLLFLPSSIQTQDLLFPLNPPSWSLFYELVTNIVFSIFRPLLCNRFLILVVVNLFLCMGYISYLKSGINIGNMSGIKAMILALIRASYGLLLGVLLYRFYKNTSGKFRFRFIITGVLLILITLAAPDFGLYDWVFDLLAVSIFIPIGVFVLAGASPNNITKSISIQLGLLSYPIYVLHGPILAIVESKSVGLLQKGNPWSGIGFVCLMIAVSYLAINIWDVPVRKGLGYLLKRPR